MWTDPGVQLGKLLKTVFLADYLANAGFLRELRRVLNPNCYCHRLQAKRGPVARANSGDCGTDYHRRG